MRFIFILMLTISFALKADPASHIKFSELSSYLETSPSARILVSQRDAEIASAHSALQWTNPELEAEHEALSSEIIDETETTIAISKSFMSPWAGMAHKKAREHEIEAAEFEYEQHLLLLLYLNTSQIQANNFLIHYQMKGKNLHKK